jgi:hypothetical protein
MAGYFPGSPRIHQFLRKFTGEEMACVGEMMKRTHFSGRKRPPPKKSLRKSEEDNIKTDLIEERVVCEIAD